MRHRLVLMGLVGMLAARLVQAKGYGSSTLAGSLATATSPPRPRRSIGPKISMRSTNAFICHIPRP
jgi:hypothetical protein